MVECCRVEKNHVEPNRSMIECSRVKYREM